MKSKIIRLLIIALTFFAFNIKAQLIVSNTLTPQQLAQLISGPGVKILNPVVHCGANGYGKYTATGSNLNISEGLLLTTGKITNAIGPNDSTNTTWYFGNKHTANTYPLLNTYTGKTTWEYCEFEFDIIPQGDTIKFDFVFASEEYEEWVGSQYNDVFGFFIKGPGISGDPGAGSYHNIALIPGTSTAVTINNVNQNLHTQYYQNNNNGSSVEYDGFTKGLKAISKVSPCDTFHLKLVVADVSDKLWDSGVFIEKITSNNIFMYTQTAAGTPNMVEGCNNGQVIFKRPTATPSPVTINYWLRGTAINGTDYPLIGSSPNPLLAKTIVIPASQTSATLNINPFADGINEGMEYITIYLGNPMCLNQITDSLRFYIQDSLYTTVIPPVDSICNGQSVQITTTGGGVAFNWSPALGLNNPGIKNPIATPSTTTIYTLTTTASNCIIKRYVKINVSNLSLAFIPTNVACNGSNNGSVNLNVNGGFSPYTYNWSGPGSFSSSSQNINSLTPGMYSVTVTGKKGCSSTGTVSISQPTAITATVTSPIYNGGFNITCNGNNSGSASAIVNGGVSPYTYSWSSTTTQTTSSANNLTAGNYTLTIKDLNNCVLTKTIILTQPAILTSSISSQQNVFCYGNTTATATLNTTGGIAPYTYTWSTSPVQSSSIATNLAAGVYTVNIKDVNNCTTIKTVSITQPTSALNANITSQVNIACYGNATGSASVTTSGGTSPYSYSWNTTPVQTNSTAVNLVAGSYVVTVIDSKNCTISVPVTITQPPTNVTAVINSQNNVSCFGTNNGSASVLASGGVPAYTYSWNSIPIQTTATAVNLIAGTYTVIVKDANNCSFNIQTTITQPATVLSASISSKSNVLCNGYNSGSATTSASGGTPSYTYSWSTTPVQTAATAVNLIAGNYTVTIKDANNCSTTQTLSITQPTSAVTASISSHNNVLCYGASSATAAVSASGGVGGYTYNWNTIPVQTVSTATALAAGNYTVTVKDANNCLTLTSVNISQPSTALSASISNIVSVKCKTNATGSSTVMASGGSGSYSYLWNSVPTHTTAVASGLIAGNYTATISDNNGCLIPVTKTITITEPAAILNATSVSPLFNGKNISCFGGNNGSINLTPTGGTPAYTYSWTGPSGFNSSSEDLSSLIAGTYSVLITDANGCTKNLNKTLTQPTLLALSTTITPATCPGFTDGAVTLVVSGGTTPLTYLWSGPSSFTANTASISGLYAGNYSTTVTDANGCIKSSVYSVTQPGSILITNTVSLYTGNNISCFGSNDGIIGSVNSTGGTPTYTYAWTGPTGFTASTANISSLFAGTYQLVVTDANGCSKSKLISLTQPAIISNTLTSSVFAGNYNIDCNGASTGSLTCSSNGGTPAYSFNWSGPSGFTSTNQNINSLFAGTYTLTTTDVNSCQGINIVTLTQPASLTTNITSPTVAGGYNITCNGLNNGAINLTDNGGTPAYTYAWSGPSGFTSTTQNPSNLIAGTYSVVVTDANSCMNSKTITLTQPNSLIASINSPTVIGGYNVSCNGNNNGSINLTLNGGTPGFTYAWTGSGAYTSNQQNPAGLIAGSYSVLVTDANNCLISTNIILTQPPKLTSNVTSSVFNGDFNISCNGLSNGTVSLIINGGTAAYSYAWTGPSGFTSNVQNLFGLQAGVYNVAVTDANGCNTGIGITLKEPPAMSLGLNSPTYAGGYNITCNGNDNGAINLTNGGGVPSYSYSWNGPSGYTSSVKNPSGLSAGIYSISITDGNSCVISSSINLTEPTLMSGSISSPTVSGGYNITCNGANDAIITQTLSGGTIPYSIIWSNGATSQNLNNITAGAYTVIVNDANNCSVVQSITISQPSTLFASAYSPTFNGGYNIKCHGNSTGVITLGSIGGTLPYTYSWTGPSAFTSTSQNLNNVGAGSYSVNVTDINGCNYTTIIILTEPGSLSASINSYTYAGGYNISCNGLSNGAITTTVNGGTQSYQYSWSGPLSYSATTASLNSLIAGSYSLTVTDTNNCVTLTTINLIQPAVLSAVANSTTYIGGYNVSCFGYNNGNVTLNLTGGTAVYNYVWTGPGSYTATTQNISSLYSGTYSLAISDANNCSFNLTQTLTQPSAIKDTMIASGFIGGNNLSCYNSNNGTLQLILTGGAPPYSQVWSGPAFTSTAASLNNLAAGMYSVLITDVNNCIKQDTIILTQPAVLSQSLSTTSFIGGFSIKCKGDSTGVVNNTMSGGTPGYTFNWTGPSGFTASTEDIYNIVAGSYTVIVTDTNNCTSISTISLSEATVALTGSLTITNVGCNGGSNGAINLHVNGGYPGYKYWWRGPNNYTSFNQNISGLFVAQYYVVITDTNGCQISIDTNITEPPPITFTYSATNPICAGGATGAIDVTLNGGTLPYSYNWSNSSTTQDINNSAAGTYSLIFSDANSCADTASIIITEPAQSLVINKEFGKINCFGDKTCHIKIDVSGGSAPYSYNWSNLSTSQNISNLGAGIYIVTVADSIGCILKDTTHIIQPNSLSLFLYSTTQFNGHNITYVKGNDGMIDLTVHGGTGPYSYLWSNNSTTEDLNNLYAGFYNVIVIDTNGCRATDTITLTEPFELEMPSGFSPNHDGKNEFFLIHGIESYPDNEVTIYNRWGNIVYNKIEYKNEWYGNSNNGQSLPDATYFVILEINNGEIVKKGYVELRR